MNDRDIKRKLKREASRLMPDVLTSVYERLDLAPVTPKQKWYFSLKNVTLMGAGASALLVLALLIPTLIPDPIVSQANTYIRLQIIPASIANSETEPTISYVKYVQPTEATPVFSYIVNTRGKTMGLGNARRNALHAENEASKIIAAGVGLTNTLNRRPTELTIDLLKAARSSGYLESYLKGNVVAYRLDGDDTNYKAELKAQIKVAIENYFREELIYGVAVEDPELAPADFSSFHDFFNQENEYRDQYNNRHNDHQNDDDRRGSNWGADIDEWMEEHCDSMPTSGHMTTTSSSEEDSDTSIPGSGPNSTPPSR